ncbi:MAG: signal recognition particle protein [Gammaproteobacteria bacterium]|nr:signal recognition particle protein [Gammaproteobacteria bacterium]
MFDGLSERLGKTIRNLRGVGRLSEDNIKDTLREVRMALLEADVALPVVKALIEQVKQRAIGTEVMKSLTPGQVMIKIVNDELTLLMGSANEEINLNITPPAVILMAGLQGAGKTTTVGKLARRLREKQKKSVMVVSADVYRPAAIDQLKTVAADVGAEFYPTEANADPVKVVQQALKQAKISNMDVLIVDTAGRLHIDAEMMDEIKRLHQTVDPVETLFVVDSMTGQDAANTAKAFNDALPLTGVILTKTDGDARGGAALSIRQITGKPIKFLGVGEKSTALEPFHPDRVASRILGMGDVVSLVEQAQENFDVEKAEKLAKKMKKGQGFDLEDFLDQFQQVKKMGGLGSLLDKLPGMPGLPQNLPGQLDEKQISRMEAIIYSMTPKERSRPEIIKGSRKRRIATGSGTQVQDVNRLLKQFTQMQKMMKKVSKGGMGKMLRGLKGQLPPGMR